MSVVPALPRISCFTFAATSLRSGAMETSDESTNKVKRIDDTMERPPQPRPIPSVLHRNANAVDPKPAPTFTWPLSTSKPSPAPRPSAPRLAMPAVVRPAPAVASAPVRAPRGTDAPPPRVEARPSAIPAPVAPPVEAKPIVPVIEIAAPVAPPMPARAPATLAAEQPVTAPAAFGSGMLQARTRRAKPSIARDDVPALPPATTFGAGVLQARASGTKKLVIAFVVAVATIAALCMAMRGGSTRAPAPATTQQP